MPPKAQKGQRIHTKPNITIALWGDTGVGKTSLINQCGHMKFSSQYKATVEPQCLTKHIVVGGQTMPMKIWDTSGPQRYTDLDTGFYGKIDVCVYVFDMTDSHSFDNLSHWKEQFQAKRTSRKPYMAVIGNKCDISTRQVTSSQANEWCDRYGMTYYETSAKDNTNVVQCFTDLCEAVFNCPVETLDENEPPPTASDGVVCNLAKTEVVQASIVDEEVEEYIFTCELMEVDKVMVSVFNTVTGVTYKTYIHKQDEWFTTNIHLFRGDFKRVLPLLRDSFINNHALLPYEVREHKDILHSTIQYTDTLFPFEVSLDIPKYVSKHGPMEDRVNSLEYQVKKLQEMIVSMKREIPKKNK
jgi:small GTP-binding protein